MDSDISAIQESESTGIDEDMLDPTGPIIDARADDATTLNHEGADKRTTVSPMGSNQSAHYLNDITSREAYRSPNAETTLEMDTEMTIEQQPRPYQRTTPNPSGTSAGDLDDLSPTIEDISDTLMHLLVETFFAHIQSWLPLIHKPRFYQKYLNPETGQFRSLKDIPDDEALVFWAMFALSARHCPEASIDRNPASKRDALFIDHAHRLYNRLRDDVGSLTIPYLQGCVLLAFHSYTAGLSFRGWIMVGVCVRLAYELELHQIDQDGSIGLSDEEWVAREEYRRLWWLVWELDRFGSTMMERPYGIDNRSMAVLVPVSDQAWFQGIQVQSVMFDTRPEVAWQCLQGCANQDERAYFLLCTHLNSSIHEERKQGALKDDRIYQLQMAINCFRLALPGRFHLNNQALLFMEDNYVASNWVLGTHLLLLSARVALERASIPANTAERSQIFRTDMLRIVNVWPPEYIAQSHPFICCLFMGDGAEFVTPLVDATEPLTSLQNHLLKLVISQYTEYWNLASVLLGNYYLSLCSEMTICV
jgi:hypothetical protein